MKRSNIILIWYLCIFLLFSAFILILFVPVYGYVTDFTLNNELSYIAKQMEQGIASLNSVLTTLDLIIITHRGDSRFMVFKSWSFNLPEQTQPISINPITLLELRDSMNLALLPYSLSVDAGLLFPDGSGITRRGIYYYPSVVPFYGSILQCGDLTLEEWRALLVSNRTFLPAMTYTSVYYSPYEAVTYSAQWAYFGFPEEITFFATLPVDGIVALLAEADVAEAAYIRMYDANGELLFSRGNKTAGPFHVIKRGSSANTTQYEIGVPDSFIAAKLQPVKNLIFLFIYAITFFVIIISFLFAWRSSLPERFFLERIRPASISTEGFNAFTGLKRIYHELADSIAVEKTRLETSLKTIETQTVLIRTQTIDPIGNALRYGDEAAALTILRDCYAALPKPEDPLIVGLLAEMLSAMILELREELSSIVPAFEPPKYVPGSQEEIFEKQYPRCFIMICACLRAHKEKKMPALGRKVLAYINEHLYDPGLYITMAAEHFGISAPTLQKLVKWCTGQTFLNYVEKRRMEKAYELLTTSADSVAAIAQVCGFSNASTFSRSFKRIYGFPPSRLQEHQQVEPVP